MDTTTSTAATNPYRNLSLAEAEREALRTGNALALRVLDAAEKEREDFLEENGTAEQWRRAGADWVGEVAHPDWYAELTRRVKALGAAPTLDDRVAHVEELVEYIEHHQQDASEWVDAILDGSAW